MQNLRLILQITSVITLLFIQANMHVNANVIVNGVSIYEQGSKPNEETKQQQLELALFDAIAGHYQKQNPEYFNYALNAITREVLLAKVNEFIDQYSVIPSIQSKGSFVTEVRARFDNAKFEARVDSYRERSKNEHSSLAPIAMVEFVRLHPESKQSIDLNGLTANMPVAGQLKEAKYDVFTNYAELSEYTNGLLNVEQLNVEYQKTSKVSPDGLHAAAFSRAGFSGAYSLVILHEVFYEGVNPITQEDHIVNTTSTALLYNAENGKLYEQIDIKNKRAMHTSKKQAAQEGINENSSALAQQIKGYLFKRDIQ